MGRWGKFIALLSTQFGPNGQRLSGSAVTPRARKHSPQLSGTGPPIQRKVNPAGWDADPQKVEQKKRIRRIATATIVAVAALVFLLLTNRWFLSPAVAANPIPADAIIVLAGGGDRTSKGAELAAKGLAPVIVYADPGRDTGSVTANRYCNGRESLPVEIICVDPQPAKTQGEARAAMTLAEQRGWENLIVVSSTDQVTRARRLLNRCGEATLQMVDVEHASSPIKRAVYEWGATLKSVTTKRGC